MNWHRHKGSLFGITMGYGPDVRGRISDRARDFSSLHSIYTDSGVRPVSHTAGTEVFFPRCKAAGALSCPLAFCNAEVKDGGAKSPLADMSSWRGADLIRPRDYFTFFSEAQLPLFSDQALMRQEVAEEKFREFLILALDEGGCCFSVLTLSPPSVSSG
jgi:hypothetical protein